MKKLIFLIMMTFSIIGFAEKLTTNGKDNLDKLKGKWENERLYIQNKNNRWYFGTYDNVELGDYEWKEIKLYKNSVFVIQNYYAPETKVKDKNLYFAYDVKYKTLVQVDRDLNIVQKISRTLDKPSN